MMTPNNVIDWSEVIIDMHCGTYLSILIHVIVHAQKSLVVLRQSLLDDFLALNSCLGMVVAS
jgi:hypothetical protein